ncbi:MAG: hypothetical protein WC714_28445 [Candidatus Obscuribacterales bacterium]|jgi:hypothetical protein
MKQPIQRYSQGFGGFGPLEKCNDGKLVTFKDHEDCIAKINQDAEEKVELAYKLHNLASRNERIANQDNADLHLKLNESNRNLGAVVVISIAFLIFNIIKTWL